MLPASKGGNRALIGVDSDTATVGELKPATAHALRKAAWRIGGHQDSAS
jgi:hypothetical protein